MNERIKILRKKLNLTQEDFGKKIGLKRNSLSQLENGVNNITDQVVLLICREFNVNEEWLKSGKGEMFVEMTRDEEISSFVGEILRNEEESFKKRFVSMLAKMDEEDWIALERIIDKMQKEKD